MPKRKNVDKHFESFLDKLEDLFENLDDVDEIVDIDEYIDSLEEDDCLNDEFYNDDISSLYDEAFEKCKAKKPSSFEGYSLDDLEALIYSPFSANSSIKINILEDEDLSKIPILNRISYILSLIAESKEIKFTKTGSFPLKIVRDIHFLGESNSPDKNVRILEKHSFSTSLTRVLLNLMGVVKEENNKMFLTEEGILLQNNPQKLLEKCLLAFTTKLLFSYFDFFNVEIKIGQFALAYSLILLAKYGDKIQPSDFYAKKYFKAFDFLKAKSYDDDYCYELRTFQRFMLQLGIIEEKSKIAGVRRIKKTDLFDKMFSVRF